jgi:spore germination protein GerM
MKALRVVVILAAFVVAALVVYRYVLQPRFQAADTITVYYSEIDGATLVPWKVSLGPDRSRKSVAAYALAQVLVGPPSQVEAIRFPAGTVTRGVTLDGSTLVADLGGTIAGSVGGSFAEAGEFKALVWTMTALPDIKAVQIEIDGRKVATLPGGHLELDQPLARSNF